MLAIRKTTEGSKTTFALEGKLNTTSAPELDAQLQDSLDGVTELVFDFTALEYISSAGLRILLNAERELPDRGQMKLIGVNDMIKDVFDATGFSDIFFIE